MKKLLRAGADQVVCSDLIGGLRMVSEMIRPHVVTFIDSMLRDKKAGMRIAEINIRSPKYRGRTISDLNIAQYDNTLVLAIQSAENAYIYNPPPQTVLGVDDTLIVMGKSMAVKHAIRVIEG